MSSSSRNGSPEKNPDAPPNAVMFRILTRYCRDSTRIRIVYCEKHIYLVDMSQGQIRYFYSFVPKENSVGIGNSRSYQILMC